MPFWVLLKIHAIQIFTYLFFMTRDKSGSINRRVIIHLSYPQPNSVNAGVCTDQYGVCPDITKH